VAGVAQIRAQKIEKPASPRRIGRPTLNDTERKSELLIDVATDFFVEHGFSGSTIEAIAHASSPQAMVVNKLAMREGHRFPELVPVLVEGTADRYTRPLAAYIEARKRAGEVRNVDAFEAASTCLALIFNELSQSVYMDTAVSPGQIAASTARIAEMLLLGLAVR
jgi:hypothetical protein